MKCFGHRLQIRRLGTEGLTIIELVMVLAIASIILTLVLLAVPALERNSRNDERRQDVQAVLEAVSHYRLNNTGAIPDDASGYLQYTKLHIYDNTSVNVHVQNVGTTSPQTETNNNPNSIQVYNYRKCSTSQTGAATNAGAGFGDVVALFAVETAGGTSPQCQQM